MPEGQDPGGRVQAGTGETQRVSLATAQGGTLGSQAAGRWVLLGPGQLLRSISVWERGRGKMQNSICSKKWDPA